ncbi:nucleoside transporter-domain-containing protein [Lanmaoa asiatica]|nr:nucleoside transporter-domain-containing protein [Lanmaoa asiatica]
MTDYPAKYRTIPSSEDHAYHSDVHEAGVSEDDLYSTTLVNGTSFFLSRLAGSPFYPIFSSYMSSVYTCTKLVCQFYCTITSKQSSLSRRIFVSIIAMIFLVTSLCLSTFIRSAPSTFLSFALFNTASLAVSAGYLCTATYAGAALLGPSFLQTVLSGQAAVAVVTSAVQVASSIISLWGSSPKPVSLEVKRADGEDNQAEEIAARIFFCVSVIFIGIVLVAYTWLTRQSFYKSVTGALEQHREVRNVEELTSLVADHRRTPQTEADSRVYHVVKQNLIFMFSIAYVFAVTLAVFPAITARVQSVNLRIHPLLFTAVHNLVLNIGDLVGRYSCSFPRLLVRSAKKILAMSLLRTLFIPLILLCNVHRPATTPPVSPIINSDILFMIILLTMGYTNGFVSSMATLTVSSLEHNPRLKGRREDVDVAATLGGSFAIVGLASGALCSFVIQAMI